MRERAAVSLSKSSAPRADAQRIVAIWNGAKPGRPGVVVLPDHRRWKTGHGETFLQQLLKIHAAVSW
jgi:hypothetical protein